MTRALAPVVSVSLALSALVFVPEHAQADVRASLPLTLHGPTIDAYATQKTQSCQGGVRPGLNAFRDMALDAVPEARDYGDYACRGTRGARGGLSDHAEGRAWDMGLNAGNPAEKAAADELIDWLLAPDMWGNANANAHMLGLQMIIWNSQVWRADRPTLQPYRGGDSHTDHIHFSFNWAGANGETSFWNLPKLNSVSGGTGEASAPIPDPAS